MKRERRGERLPPEVAADEVVLPYRGLRPTCVRRTRIRFRARAHRHRLGSRDASSCSWTPAPSTTSTAPSAASATTSRSRRAPPTTPRCARTMRRATAWLGGHCTVVTSNPLVNLWLHRSVADLSMLTTQLPTGPYPFAGVPWYSTTFGRDGIITALECLWVDPSLARGVLTFLAATQATEMDRAERRRAGQDPARGAAQRNGADPRDPVRPLLRLGRLDAAVPGAGRGLLAAHRRCGADPRHLAQHPRGAALDRPLRRRRRRRLRRIRAAQRRGPGAAGLEGFARLDLPRRRPAGRRRRSRCARCRATSTKASWLPPRWRA